MSNEGVEPGQVWELPIDGTLLLVVELEGGPFGSLLCVDLDSGRLTSLFQTTMGMLAAQGQARRIA